MIRIIGDLNGRTDWEYAIEGDEADTYIFLGNYVDGPFKDAHIVENLQRILTFKQNYGERCVLLLGAKDIQYRDLGAYKTNTFRDSYSVILHNLFKANKKNFQIAHQIDNYLFTNAGVSQEWSLFAKESLESCIESFKPKDFAELINMMDYSRHQIKLHWKTPCGPTQLNTDAILSSPIPEYHQFIGGYATERIVTHKNFKGTSYTDRSVTLCNCLSFRTEFFNLIKPNNKIEYVENIY